MKVATHPSWIKVSGPENMDPVLAENAALEKKLTHFIRNFFFIGPKSVVQTFGNDSAGAIIAMREVMELEPHIKQLLTAVHNVVRVRNTGLPLESPTKKD